MHLDTSHILSLAPDPASAAAGRKLSGAGAWQNLGRDDGALWGECRGSALYQVRVDARDFAAKCTCPSQKFPCKHSLGLLLLAAADPVAVPERGRPEWVATWIAGRAGSAQAKRARQTKPAGADRAQQDKRAEKRLALVRQGIEGLDLWLHDVIRTGIAGIELRDGSFWEKQAARLVDCQAPSLAQRVRRLAAIPGSSPHWPSDLLAALGSLALLTEAFSRLDSLTPALQADVRGSIGWTLKEDEVIAHGDLVHDSWTVFGQWIEEEERLRTQRTWLRGDQSGRAALVLQFSVAGSAFGAPFVSGAALDATLAFWPSGYPLRAFVSQRHASPRLLNTRVPGLTTIEGFLGNVSRALSLQPWLDRFPCLLREVTPSPSSNGPWQVIDAEGRALPLSRGDHWRLLAVSGGYPIDLFGEWRDGALLPLGMQAGAAYLACGAAA